VHFTQSASRIRSYEDVVGPVSWLDLKNAAIKVNAHGVVLDPENLVASGYMSSLRIADLLPNDYEPEVSDRRNEVVPLDRSINAMSLYEKVYLQTDKPYYYPGERIWFKSYLNYYLPSSRDSLSNTTQYVELINPFKEVVMEKMLRIDSGFAANDFLLPDTIKTGNYFIRAYTQLQRNFGDENLFVAPLPVLHLNDKPVYTNEKEERMDQYLNVTSDKPRYGKREKVVLMLGLKDTDANPMTGIFSIAVTDASQVMKITGQNTILEKFPIGNEWRSKTNPIKYSAEFGFSINGQYTDRGKAGKAVLNIVQFEPFRLALVDTDDKGYFQYSALQFFGEHSLSIGTTTKKGKPHGLAIN